MPGTKDNLNQLIEDIEKDGFNFVIGIIKPSDTKDNNLIDIFTNISENGLDKLLAVLKEHKKSIKLKEKEKKIESK